ncbi:MULTISPECIES: GntR family transcriptional regulator [unclassified Streptomyces]|uniref:GntR family transcriptional regulator n=1 Tax=unclassified Streptomyces TaxID=2593676 RepID=UPI00081D86A3|nr:MULTISPECIES: GntR family transcriptional regulator [unclassified Streptomyces]MYZ37354.1 UTRA domain-containing protein [Streptomyces sp. SID4917]SCF90706.1 GntR family transcriptional regulator [Streptomyces sp. MnatMP-M17]
MKRTSPDRPWTVDTVTADLHRRILDGEFRQPDGSPGRLPIAGELAAAYGLSRQTMGRVIERLKGEGLVHTRPGAPHGAMIRNWEPLIFAPQQEFDRDSADSDIYTRLVRAAARAGTSRMDDVKVMRADDEIRNKLGLRPGEHVGVRRRTNIVDGVPAHTDDSFVPLRIVDGTDWLLPGSVARGTNTVLAELGHELVRAIDELEPRMTTEEENRRLAIGDGNSLPAIQLTSTGFDRDGTPVQVTRFTLPRRRNTVVYERTKPDHSDGDTE